MGRRLDEAHPAPAQPRLVSGQRIDRFGQLLAMGYQAVQRHETLAIRQAQAPHFLPPSPFINMVRGARRAGAAVICLVSPVFMPPS
jgi:hypothetical protein